MELPGPLEYLRHSEGEKLFIKLSVYLFLTTNMIPLFGFVNQILENCRARRAEDYFLVSCCVTHSHCSWQHDKKANTLATNKMCGSNRFILLCVNV